MSIYDKNIRLGKKYWSEYHIIENFKVCKKCKGDILEKDWLEGTVQCRKCLTCYEIFHTGKYMLKKSR